MKKFWTKVWLDFFTVSMYENDVNEGFRNPQGPRLYNGNVLPDMPTRVMGPIDTANIMAEIPNANTGDVMMVKLYDVYDNPEAVSMLKRWCSKYPYSRRTTG